MSWPSFEMRHVDPKTLHGFVLIGRLVRRRRERLRITQRQLEDLSDVDQSMISRLENGRLAGIRWTSFARLVDALGGIGENDPLPAWTARFLPDHQARATATMVERRDGIALVNRSPATPSANVGQ